MRRVLKDEFYCSGVYMITNNVTKEKYVGASKNVASRILLHFSREVEKYPEKKMYQDIKKLGSENFTISLLQKQCVYDKDELLKMEQFWYDTLKPEYNMIRPQENHLLDPLTKKRAKDSEKWKKASEIRKTLYRTDEYRKLFSQVQNKRKKKCRMFNDVFSMEFESLIACAKWLDENTTFKGKNKTSKVKAVCDGERTSAFGFKYEYLEGVQTILEGSRAPIDTEFEAAREDINVSSKR